jgi:hypothetical protein
MRMNGPARFALVTTLAVCAACGGDEGAPPQDGALTAVSPVTAYVGRTIELFIAGAGTHFGGRPAVTFNDPGMKAVNVDVLSPASLRVLVEVGFETTVGAHDVIVTTAGQGDVPEERVVLPKAIDVSAPLKYEASATVTQGGLFDFAVTNVDKENPFGGEAPLFTFGASLVSLTDVSPTRIAGTALVDITAPIGGLRLGLRTRSASGELLGYGAAPEDPMSPKVTAAPPVLALAPGVTASGEALAAPRQTNLYQVAAAADEQIFFLSMKSVGSALRTSGGARLVGATAPASGRFSEGATFETSFATLGGGRVAVGLVPKGGDVFFAIHTSDFSGGPAEYNYTLRAAVQNGTKFSTAEPVPPDSPSAPVAVVDIMGPLFSTDGTIDTAGDADYVIVTPATTGRLIVSAAPVESSARIDIAIFGDDPGESNCTAFVAGGLGTRQAEITATGGTAYCVRVTGSAAKTRYRLVITPEL